MIRPMPLSAHQGTRGFSLIEAMVALLVLAVGMLGVASLQTLNLKHSHASFQRSVAVVQANDLVERLWVGICGLPGNSNDIRDAWRAEHATSLLDQWQGDLDLLNPGQTPYRFQITVSWTDGRMDTAEQFQFVASIPAMTNCPP